MLLCLCRATGILPCASYLQLLPYRLKLLLIYLLYLQEADTHTEKVLLLPRKYLPVILWSSLPFLLPPGTTEFIYWWLFSRNSLIRLARAAYNTITQEELSYKSHCSKVGIKQAHGDHSVLIRRKWRWEEGNKNYTSTLKWGCLRTFSDLTSQWSKLRMRSLKHFRSEKTSLNETDCWTAKMIWSIGILLDSS